VSLRLSRTMICESLPYREFQSKFTYDASSCITNSDLPPLVTGLFRHHRGLTEDRRSVIVFTRNIVDTHVTTQPTDSVRFQYEVTEPWKRRAVDLVDFVSRTGLAPIAKILGLLPAFRRKIPVGSTMDFLLVTGFATNWLFESFVRGQTCGQRLCPDQTTQSNVTLS